MENSKWLKSTKLSDLFLQPQFLEDGVYSMQIANIYWMNNPNQADMHLNSGPDFHKLWETAEVS